MATIVESVWLYVITHFNDFQLACLGSFFLHESVFFLSGLPFIYFERAGWLSKYKIQNGRLCFYFYPFHYYEVGWMTNQYCFLRIQAAPYPFSASHILVQPKNNSPEAQEKCITRLLLYHFCVNLPVMIVSYPVFRFMGMRSSLPLPSWKVISIQILFYFILEDFVFYWGHRILHTKWLYKHVHSVHHEYATPFGLTSEYAHPAEILFLGFATIIGPVITGPHLITLWLWMVVRVLETVEAHCGYHFPWSLSNFLPLYGGADFHDYHHRLLYTKSGNYSSTFIYMDWIFGTDKGYRRLKALKSS
ncbi:methylsterol monooxygenase 2-2-like isoform X1 [Camellia sinensis]|uniref:methylsterol monooxygenase 2-2-like isoform X1 n=2 Tax=Camellia sinensis TaxID=4442 RepID=UPI001035CC2B|nr:methylsterol monooxygenase 2-2-like isoform X1 [Camellia sinensis]